MRILALAAITAALVSVVTADETDMQQVALEKIAEQITQDSETTCTAPKISECEISCSGSGCNFDVILSYDGIVTTLDAWRDKLKSIPTEIGLLTGLTSLGLYYNSITSIPTEIGLLTELTILDFDGNQLKNIPTEIGRLAALERLLLIDNYLTALPREMTSLTQLTYEDGYSEVNGNYLDCSDAASSLPNGLGNTDFCSSQNTCSDKNPCTTPCTGVPGSCQIECGDWTYSDGGEYCKMCMDHCKECDDGESCKECAPGYHLYNSKCYTQEQYALFMLAEQITQDSETTCTAPDLESFEDSSSVESNCNIAVGITDNVVTSLDISGNSLTDLPTEIAYLTALVSLDISNNLLTVLPTELAGMTSLTTTASYNYLDCNVYSYVKDCDYQILCSKVQNCIDPCQEDTENNVCRIQCGDGTYRSGDHCYHCGDNVCSECSLGLCTKCGTGYVLDNGECFEADQYVLDKIASSLGPSCTATLDGPSDCPAGFTHHVDGDGITALALESCGITDLPSEITYLTSLASLDLSSNNIATLPSVVTELATLTSLVLSGNNLADIPADLTNLASLAALDLSSNSMSALPSVVTTLATLTALDLSGNRLTVLPAEITMLNLLASLAIDNNLLTVLPTELAGMTSLTITATYNYLDCDLYSYLTGCEPQYNCQTDFSDKVCNDDGTQKCGPGFYTNNNNHCGDCPGNAYCVDSTLIPVPNCVDGPARSDEPQCTQCKGGFTPFQGECDVCADGSFSDGQQPCQEIIEEITGCAEYSKTTGMCTKCADVEYVESESESGEIHHTACPQNCAEFDNSGCVLCDAGYGLGDNHECTKCSSNQYSDGSGSCVLIPENCVDTGMDGMCKRCKSTFALNGKGGCVECPDGTVGIDGYTCFTEENCAFTISTDDGEIKCEECNGGYGLTGGKCTKCDSEHYSNGQQACQPITFLHCCQEYSKTTGECTQCNGAFYTLDNNVCVALNCAEHDASNKTLCTKCDTGYGLDATDSVCIKCGDNQFSNGQQACQPITVVTGCAEYSTLTGKCTQCDATHALVGEACVEKPVKCDTVNAEGKCTKCVAGYALSDNACVECTAGTYSADGNACKAVTPVEGCAAYSTLTGKCLQCKDLHTTVVSGGSVTCTPYIAHCAIMANNISCVQCQPGYAPSESSCIECTGNSYSADGKECVELASSSKCVTLLNHTGGACLVCMDGHEAVGGVCTTCGEGTWSVGGGACSSVCGEFGSHCSEATFCKAFLGECMNSSVASLLTALLVLLVIALLGVIAAILLIMMFRKKPSTQAPPENIEMQPVATYNITPAPKAEEKTEAPVPAPEPEPEPEPKEEAKEAAEEAEESSESESSETEDKSSSSKSSAPQENAEEPSSDEESEDESSSSASSEEASDSDSTSEAASSSASESD